ncbi:hypothetical protein ACTXT7_003270 [Hymenolepis weldensis]
MNAQAIIDFSTRHHSTYLFLPSCQSQFPNKDSINCTNGEKNKNKKTSDGDNLSSGTFVLTALLFYISVKNLSSDLPAEINLFIHVLMSVIF